MKIFISWSGKRSQALANAIRDWLPNVIQAIEPWVSADDIDKGSRWSTDIAIQLEESKIGIICLTPENLEAQWILFEAGALSKTLKKTYVCPYLFEVEPADIKGPLVQFQSTRANKNDTLKLIHTINQALEDEALPKEKLNEAFEVWWPKFEKSLENIPYIETKQEPQRSDREILEEILELVREQTRFKKLSFSEIKENINKELPDSFIRNYLTLSGKNRNEELQNYRQFVKKIMAEQCQEEDDTND